MRAIILIAKIAYTLFVVAFTVLLIWLLIDARSGDGAGLVVLSALEIALLGIHELVWTDYSTGFHPADDQHPRNKKL